MRINKNIIWVIVGVLVVALLVMLGIKLAKNSTLNIYVVPSSAEVVVNGGSYKNGAVSFFPGEYTVEIKANGFESKTVNISLEANHSANLFIALKANDDFYEQTANSDDYALLEEIAKFDEDAKNIVDDIKSAEKIYDKLPKSFRTTHHYFAIEKSDKCKKILCLRVRNIIGNNYETAVNEIRKMGYDPERYEIINDIDEGEEK